jgi:sugar O-acyltransferase (sialic acid O-acetyltransferase NeuD family)
MGRMTRQRLVVIGAGGFAREVKWLIKEINQADEKYQFLGYVVSDSGRLGDLDSKAEVLGDLSWLEHGDTDGLVIGIGTPEARFQVGCELQKKFPSLNWPALVHPSVRMDWETANLGPGVILCAGTIGTVNITIRDFAMVNLACTLGHECRIGMGSVLNPTVNISGGVVIGDRVLIGTGAQVLQYLKVGDNTIVGAGAVVSRDLPPNVIAVGMPAKPIKKREEN